MCVCFHRSLGLFFSRLVKNDLGVLILIALDLPTTLGSTGNLMISILLTTKKEICPLFMLFLFQDIFIKEVLHILG